MKKTTILILLAGILVMSVPDSLRAGDPSNAGDPLKTGEKVPDFTARDDNGEDWTLSEQRSDYIVIYFYPAAFTGGCTKQACSYRDYDTQFKLLNTTVIGISGDEYGNLGKFREQHQLNFTLLSDTEGEIAGIFGVPARDGGSIEREINGEALQLSRGVTTSRWTFVIDVNGKLIYRDKSVSAATDPETVLKFITTYEQRRSCLTGK
jgi:peroxiredoxin Q/BCP